MIEGTRQTEGLTDPLKKLQKVHQDQQQYLHKRQQLQMQTFLARHRLTYEKAATKQVRARLLTTYVQKLNALKHAHALSQKRLLTRQVKQRENLIVKAIGLPEFNRQKRIKTARSIIETYIKSNQASSVPL